MVKFFPAVSLIYSVGICPSTPCSSLRIKFTPENKTLAPKMFTVVCTDYNFEDLELEARIIEGHGGRLEAHQCFDEPGLQRILAHADAVISQYAVLTPAVIRAMRKARGIVRYGIGVDTVDIPAATESGIWVTNVPDYCIEEVATHALSLLLALARRVPEADRQVRRDQWDNNALRPIHPVCGKTLGFLGFGRIARALAGLVSGFRLRLLAYDPYLRPEAAAALGTDLGPLEQVLSEADFISIHLPLTPESRHLISAPQLRLMKPGSFLVNTARGPVVDTTALVEALRTGHLGGAALDTVENEPIPSSHPLLQLDNVIVTPHIGWYSERSREELRCRVAEEAARLALGQPPLCPVNQPRRGLLTTDH